MLQARETAWTVPIIEAGQGDKNLVVYWDIPETRNASKGLVTRQIIPGKMVTKYRFQVYDVTDSDNPSDTAIWERGYTEADQVLYWLEKGKTELTIMRNRAKANMYVGPPMVARL